MRPNLRLVTVVGVLLMTLGAGRGETAPITSNTALPIAQGQALLRVQTKYTRATGDPGPGNRELEAWAVPLVGVYGATAKLALFAILPYLDKELEMNTPAGRQTRETSGLGDLRLLARYTAWQRDRRGETIRLAPFVGVETPTGENDAADSLGRLPRTLQLGSGSWDPFAGAVLTWQRLAWQFDTTASYQHNTEADEFRFGDQLRLDASYQYRLWPRKLGAGVPAFVYGVIEANGIRQEKNRFDGNDDPDSGGTTVLLAPGLQHVTRRTVVETAVQFPVYENLNGDAFGPNLIWTLSFRMNF